MNISHINSILKSRGSEEAASTADAAGLGWIAEKIRNGKWDLSFKKGGEEKTTQAAPKWFGRHYVHCTVKENDFGKLIAVRDKETNELEQYVIFCENLIDLGATTHCQLGPVSRKDAEYEFSLIRVHRPQVGLQQAA